MGGSTPPLLLVVGTGGEEVTAQGSNRASAQSACFFVDQPEGGRYSTPCQHVRTHGTGHW